jgi:hypothetical protein
METRQAVVEQMWELLAISSIDSIASGTKYQALFLYRGSSRLQSQKQQNLEPLKEVMLMGNWR